MRKDDREAPACLGLQGAIMASILGIDIAKSKFDVVLLCEGRQRHKVFDNDESGYLRLAAWLEQVGAGSLHACIEATGRYELALFLHEHGYRVSVVNPARIKAYGASELLRTKTDKVDAGLIARFCQAQSPDIWAPPSARLRQLRALVRSRDGLKDMRTREILRRQAGTASPLASASIERMIALLDAEIEAVMTAISALIAEDGDLARDFALLTSIPGVGAQSAVIMQAEVGDFRAFRHNKQITAFAGLDPQQKQSGSSVRGRSRLSKIGNPRLRSALYMCALSGRRHNPTLRAFAENLKAAGKPPKAVLGAVARKLLVIAYGVMKTQRPFEVA
jgi:transposase